MKYFELDKEERGLLGEYEKGGLKRVKDAKQKATIYQRIARNALNKTKNINIRISEYDLQKIRTKASEKGIPYQTLVSSIIHQYSKDKVEEKV